MHARKSPQTPRRSSRVPATIPILVTCLEPRSHFSEVCETLVVNVHGCALRTPMPLDAGVPMQLQIADGRQVTARVVDCQPIGSDGQGWIVGATLDQPANFWGLKPCPEDWKHLLEISGENPTNSGKAGSPKMPMLRDFVTELMEPLQTEIADLREKLAQSGPKRSSFEVSLSHIPPEVEEKLEMRLRQHLGTQVLEQSRQQAEQVLAAAKAAIEQKINEGQEDFRQRAAQQLQALEQRAYGISEDVAERVRQHLRAGGEELQQQVGGAGTRLKQQSEEFLQALRQRLGEEHESYRQDMQKVQAAAASESSRLQAQIGELGSRVAKLDESAGRLEADAEARLARVAGDIVSGARTQLETAVAGVLSAQMARLNKEINDKLLPVLGQSESLIGDVRSTTDSLRAENDRAGLQIAAVREEKQQFQQWLGEQASAYKTELRGQLEQKIYEAAAGAATRIENDLKTSLTAHLDRARTDLNAEMERLVNGTKSLEKSLIQDTGAWLAQQSNDFQKQIHDALTETSGRIRGRVDLAVEEISSRNAKELGNRLDEACEHLKSLENEISASVSGSLTAHVGETLQSFRQTMEETAQHSVGRWRLALARDLNSVAKILGEQFRPDAVPNRSENR